MESPFTLYAIIIVYSDLFYKGGEKLPKDKLRFIVYPYYMERIEIVPPIFSVLPRFFL